MKLYRLLIISLLLSITLPSFAQDYQQVVRSNIKQEINGREYYLHKVKKGETLSAIARAYHISVDDIRGNNYGIVDQINPGDIIKIPVETTQKVNETEPGGMNYRRVAKGETLYSLAKEYNVTVDEIKAANDGLPDGLKTGSFIIIPVHTPAESVESGQQEKTKSHNWFEYQAKAREDLYALAIKYRVSIDSILALNPGVGDHLSPGQIIKIPLKPTPEKFITHTVKDRQTMNRLARKYNLDVEKLKKENPYISRHLQVGQVVRIPLPQLKDVEPIEENLVNDLDRELTKREREKTEEEVCHNSYEMGSYDVALILPFYLSVYDSVTMAANESMTQDEHDFIKPFVFIQFYEGFMMAVDSMKKAGLDATIHVYNLDDDIQQAKMLVKNPDLKNMDLIVGPVYGNTFKIVADFAKDHRINIVNPLSTREETAYGNPYVFQPQPVYYDENEKLVEYLNKYHDYSQIFIARHNAYRDELAMNELKNALNKNLDNRKIPSTGLYQEIIFNRDSTYTFEHLASVDHPNVVVVYSENKVFILDILRSLNELRDTFNIEIIGMPEWKEIEGLEAEHLNNLNTHILARDFADYNLKPVRRFVSAFREKYKTEPNEYAFSGYDIGAYFLAALMKFGPEFNHCIPYFKMELLDMGFDFRQIDSNSGFRNRNWKILGMQDFHFRDVSKRLKTYDLSKPPEPFYQSSEE